METQTSANGYGGRPMWQWILLYVVIGGLIYGLVYYFVLAKKGGYSDNSTMMPQYGQPTAAPAAAGAPTGNIYQTKTDPAKGPYLADFQGMTLYIFDKDTPGVSNCYNGCAAAWPAYSSGATAQSTLPANITVIKRTDGKMQFAWKGMPLYYYATDQKAGDITGDGVGGVWHIVKP